MTLRQVAVKTIGEFYSNLDRKDWPQPFEGSFDKMFYVEIENLLDIPAAAKFLANSISSQEDLFDRFVILKETKGFHSWIINLQNISLRVTEVRNAYEGVVYIADFAVLFRREIVQKVEGQ